MDARDLLPRDPQRYATPRRVGFLAFLVVYGYLLRDVHLGSMYAFGDLPPYYGTRALGKFASLWHPHQLGYEHIFNVIPAYVGVLTAVGGATAQNLFYLALLPLGFLSFHVFVSRFVEHPVARTLAAGLYALNPITVSEFVGGGVGALLAFAGLPLVLHFLYETVERDAWRPALAAGAVFGAVAAIPYLAFWMVAPFATYLLYRSRDHPWLVAKLATAGMVGVVLALPSVHYLFERANTLGSPDNLFNYVSWNYEAADPLAVLRLAGNHGSFGMNQLGYNTEPTMVVGLVIPAVALLGWRRRQLRYLVDVVLVLVLFMTLTRYRVTYPLFEAFPPLFSLRNPSKLQYPLLIAMGLLFGSGVEELFDGLRQAYEGTLVRWFLVLLLVIPLFAYVAPASGALGLDATRGDEYYVPESYDDLSTHLEGKVLWVPYSYTTQLRLRHTYPDHVGIRSGGLDQGKENAGYVTDLFRDVAAGRHVAPRLRNLGVRYVVVDATPQTRYQAADGPPRLALRHGAPWLFGDPAAFERRLAASPAYTEAFSSGPFTVYRVVGADERGRYSQFEGLHRVYAPTAASGEAYGENRLTNGAFDDGLAGWWTWSGDTGTQTTVVETDDGEHAARLVTEGEPVQPISQQVSLEPGAPYRLETAAEGNGSLVLFWYDGEKSEDNLTAKRSYPLDEPVTITAETSTLSLRVRPNTTDLLVERVVVSPSTYPPVVGYEANAAGIPGAVVDGRATSLHVGKTVAVNLGPEAVRELDPDVRVVDAETRFRGQLLRGESYRQGVAVLVTDEARLASIPDGARVVSHDHPRGTVVDYWVVGSFDDTPTTVRWTSYDDRWQGPADATHFRAFGWANGFTDADPEEVRRNGEGRRSVVLGVWAVAWVAVLAALGGLRLRNAYFDHDPHRL